MTDMRPIVHYNRSERWDILVYNIDMGLANAETMKNGSSGKELIDSMLKKLASRGKG